MAARDVDSIIEAWRNEAGGPAPEPGSTGPGTAPRRGRALLRRFGALRTGAAMLALLVFVLVAVQVAAGGDPVVAQAGGRPESAAAADAGGTVPQAAAPAEPAPPAEVPAAEWFAVVRAADRTRGAAYASQDAEALADAFAPGSPAARREESLIASLRSQGMRAEGWRTELQGVAPVEVTGDRAVLRVTDRRSAYDLVDDAGARRTVPAAVSQTWTLTLVRDGSAWKLSEVEVA